MGGPAMIEGGGLGVFDPRDADLAGTFIALGVRVVGWFVVLRGQLFAGDALTHVRVRRGRSRAAVARVRRAASDCSC